MTRSAFISVLAAGVVGGTAACAGPADSRSLPDSGTTVPSDTLVPAPRRPGTDDSGARSAIRYVVAPTGNEVRYRVREQLVGVDLPNDAVGKSSAVSGSIAIDADGRILPESRIQVDASTFVSDRDRRDGYVRRRLLTVEQYPTITLAPTEVRGLTFPLPTSGTKTFELRGDLTVRGVTRPTTWQVTATFAQGRITGSASTGFTFADFEMQKPRVPVVLSVADDIKLEYDFALVPDSE